MSEVTIWIVIGFISGSIPWALLVGKVLLGKDIRGVGDANPGTANAWKLGGWLPGTLSLLLEVSKGFLPVYFALQYLGHPSDFISQISLSLIAISPVLGHAWTPFLGFKGGKALASSGGSWIAVTSGLALPIMLILLGFIHGFQKNHAITVTLSVVGMVVLAVVLGLGLYIALFGLVNFIVIVWKHRSEYSDGVIVRKWVLGIMRPSP